MKIYTLTLSFLIFFALLGWSNSDAPARATETAALVPIDTGQGIVCYWHPHLKEYICRDNSDD